jgi:hypothetical protein
MPNHYNGGNAPFDCSRSELDYCGLDEVTRAAYHCGFMDREDWRGDKPDLPAFIGFPEDPQGRVSLEGIEVCPGWIVRQPAIVEAGHSAGALEKGQLGLYYPKAENVILEAAMEFVAAQNNFESAQMRNRDNGG